MSILYMNLVYLRELNYLEKIDINRFGGSEGVKRRYAYISYHSQFDELEAPPASKEAVESLASITIDEKHTGMAKGCFNAVNNSDDP